MLFFVFFHASGDASDVIFNNHSVTRAGRRTGRRSAAKSGPQIVCRGGVQYMFSGDKPNFYLFYLSAWYTRRNQT